MKTAHHLAVCLLLTITSTFGYTVFQDEFETGNGGWYKAASSGTLTNDANRLSWTSDSGGSAVPAVIAKQFPTTTLDDGDILRLTLNFTQTNGSPIRFGLGLYQFSNQIIGDGWGSGSAIIGGTANGYSGKYWEGISTNVYRENSVISNDILQAPGPLNNFGTIVTSGPSPSVQLIADGSVVYTLQLEIARYESTRHQITTTLSSGGTTIVSVTGLSGGPFPDIYNTLAIRSSSGTAIYDDIRLEVIPEPSVTALFFASALGCIWCRSRSA